MKQIVTVLFVLSLLFGGCVSKADFGRSLNSVVKPYAFSVGQWEFKTASEGMGYSLITRQSQVQNETETVHNYFRYSERIGNLAAELQTRTTTEEIATIQAELNALQSQKTSLKKAAEQILRKEIREALTEQGIYNPWAEYIRLKIGFPPVNFRLESPPHILVVSPRQKIERLKGELLQQELSLAEINRIEAEADKLGVSSLVVEIGGLGTTYPTFVTDDGDPRAVIEGAAHEWVHQYLALRPLGFLYVLDLLGIKKDYDIATMNETVADIVGKEVGDIVYRKFYPEAKDNKLLPSSPSGFDFNREMREIRKAVEQYLARGEIERAETFLEEKRQFMATKGYYIRKLNQAYFAFHGTYADSPTSISPIGAEMKELRRQSQSLKQFLDSAAALTSPQGLRRKVTPAGASRAPTLP